MRITPFILLGMLSIAQADDIKTFSNGLIPPRPKWTGIPEVLINSKAPRRLTLLAS